jgi:hypothetical protein
MAVHHQLAGQPQAAGAGLGQHRQGGLQGQLRLAADRRLNHPLGHRPHLDHQAAGPALHQKTGLAGIGLMQIHRQAEAALQAGRQGEIRRPAPIEHQGIAHGAGGAVQIEGHGTGPRPGRPETRQQLPGPLQLQGIGLGGGSRQAIRLKAAVEIAIAVAGVGGPGGGVADLQLQGQAGAGEAAGMAPPVLQQPGGIALVAVGPRHHQHRARPPLRRRSRHRRAAALQWIFNPIRSRVAALPLEAP